MTDFQLISAFRGGDKCACDELLNKYKPVVLRVARRFFLSGGETEKLALARLMMDDYGLLILDEPTAAMDVNAVENAERILKEYFDRVKPTVLIVTHSPAQAKRMADELIFLNEGRVAETGPVGKLMAEPGSEELKRFLSVNF